MTKGVLAVLNLRVASEQVLFIGSWAIRRFRTTYRGLNLVLIVFWQAFGRLRLESNQAMQRKRDFSSPWINVYADKNDYAL